MRQWMRLDMAPELGGGAGDRDATGSGCASSSGDGQLPIPPRPPRGPDHRQRVKRTWRETGSGPDSPHDWTDFGIGRVARVFRTNRESAIRLSPRKLHARWWHASEHTMRRFLEVGVNEKHSSSSLKCARPARCAESGPSQAQATHASPIFRTSSTSKLS